MAIAPITLYTGSVPLIGQSQTVFDTNTGTLLSFLPTFSTDLNGRITEINAESTTINGYVTTATTQAGVSTAQAVISTAQAVISTSQASIATTKANEILGYVIPTTATYSIDELNKRNSSMSKATFEALARDNRDKFAGSGFVEFGRHSSDTSNQKPVNEGMWTWSVASAPSLPDVFLLGNDRSDNAGKSKTTLPLTNLNGTAINIRGVNAYPGLTDIFSNQIQLPPAPTVTHADASNSGLILNGKFDTDVSNWNNVTWDTGRGKATDAGADVLVNQIVKATLVVGIKYTLEVEPDIGSFTSFDIYNNSSATYLAQGVGSGRHTVTFTASTTSDDIIYYFRGGSSGAGGFIDNVFLTETASISRTDLVFIESWHEDTSEKGVLYDLGNVQYKGTISAGTAGTFVGQDTYSLFGNWQEANTLVGNSISIVSLTDVQLKTFVGNPENNCYYDGDKLIQVRYRVRTIDGLGDTWANVDTQSTNTAGDQFAVFSYTSYLANNVLARGSSVTGDDLGVNSVLQYLGDANSVVNTDIGTFKIRSSSTSNAYEGKCFALPIALVHRRNQGAYHPVFNSNGTKGWYAGGINRSWYHSTVIADIDSVAQCFAPQGVDTTPTTASGYIGAVSYRPDTLFYDQIAEGDITDLRSSAHDTNDMEVMNNAFNRAISGSERGSEGEWEIVDNVTGTVDGVATGTQTGTTTTQVTFTSESLLAGKTGYLYGTEIGKISGTVKASIELNDGSYADAYCVYDNGTNTIVWVEGNLTGLISTATVKRLIVSTKSTRTKSNTMTHCDIIGNPANYPQSWKDNGVIGTPLLVGENGEDYLGASYTTVNQIKMSKKAISTILTLYSDNNGATWGTLTNTINSTTNTNSTTVTLETAFRIFMVFYTTPTNMAEPTVNSVIRNGVIGDAVIFRDCLSSNGSYLLQSLLNKVPTESNSRYRQWRGIKLQGHGLFLGKLSTDNTYSAITHEVAVGVLGTTSPTVKVLPYLTTENGRKVVNLVFKEMKYNTTWGDDSKFNIVDKVSTTLDNNAQVVLVGQKKIVTPYFAKEK